MATKATSSTTWGPLASSASPLARWATASMVASASTCPRGPRAGSSSPGVDKATLHSCFSHSITAPPSPSTAACPSPSTPRPVLSVSGWPSAWLPSSASCWEPWLCSASCLPSPAWPCTSAASTAASTGGEPWAGPARGGAGYVAGWVSERKTDQKSTFERSTTGRTHLVWAGGTLPWERGWVTF